MLGLATAMRVAGSGIPLIRIAVFVHIIGRALWMVRSTRSVMTCTCHHRLFRLSKYANDGS